MEVLVRAAMKHFCNRVARLTWSPDLVLLLHY